VSTAKSLFLHRESDVWDSLRSQRAVIAEAKRASPNGAPKWRTFGCSVMS
jgi:indole-3-glycerol phosphate synthase